jgi:hypothetical protein
VRLRFAGFRLKCGISGWRGEFDVVVVGGGPAPGDLEVPEAELVQRRAQLSPLAPTAGCGWLSV